MLRIKYLKVDRTLKQLFRLFFRFPQTLATRMINANTLAQKRTAMTTQATKKILISQADNYAGNFGEVLRSSAIFWVKNDEHLRTTISFSNYWKYKNFTDVRVLINLRNLSGEILNRQVIEFESIRPVNTC